MHICLLQQFNSIQLTGRLMFTDTLALGDRGYEIEIIIALFEMDAGISESQRTVYYRGMDKCEECQIPILINDGSITVTK